jgi:hypothetical protein
MIRRESEEQASMPETTQRVALGQKLVQLALFAPWGVRSSRHRDKAFLKLSAMEALMQEARVLRHESLREVSGILSLTMPPQVRTDRPSE